MEDSLDALKTVFFFQLAQAALDKGYALDGHSVIIHLTYFDRSGCTAIIAKST